MNIQIDHVVIAGSDLAQLTARFEAIGLKPDPGGVHADGQTHNALIGFADGSYLELIAPTPGNTAPKHPWAKFMINDAGVCAWAIRSNNIEEDVALYRSRGIFTTGPHSGGRTRPDGVRLEWITAEFGTNSLGLELPFLIQDITPRDWRVPITESAAGVITGIDKVLIDGRDHWLDMIRTALDISLKDLMNSTNLPLAIDLPDQGRKGVCGVVLNTSDLDLARQRYHAGEKHTKWGRHASAWPDLGNIVLGFSEN
jgi:hypothetical protein